MKIVIEKEEYKTVEYEFELPFYCRYYERNKDFVLVEITKKYSTFLIENYGNGAVTIFIQKVSSPKYNLEKILSYDYETIDKSIFEEELRSILGTRK